MGVMVTSDGAKTHQKEEDMKEVVDMIEDEKEKEQRRTAWYRTQQQHTAFRIETTDRPITPNFISLRGRDYTQLANEDDRAPRIATSAGGGWVV